MAALKIIWFPGAKNDLDLGRKGSNYGPNDMIQNMLMLLRIAFLSIKGASYLSKNRGLQ